MEIVRTIETKLIEWKDSAQRMPLLVRGARQVGKSYTIRKFATTHFEKTYEINFERQPQFKKFFSEAIDPKTILHSLELEFGNRINSGRDLIFFDEIQECPLAIQALRYFFEEAPEYHVCAAGSLIEFVLEQISFPVGRVQNLFVYPLSFIEFIRARGAQNLEPFIPQLASLSPPKNWELGPQVAIDKLYGLLKEYFIVGGMPRVVREYIATNSFLTAAEIQDELIQSFQDDAAKYCRGKLQLVNLSQLMSNVVKHIGKQISYSSLVPEDSYKRTKSSLELLEKAMLITTVPSVNPSGLPLGAEASSKHFKSIFLDIGLMQRWSGSSAKEYLHSQNLLDIYQGRLAEQFVGQQLLSASQQACEGRKLYCWIRPEKSAAAEIDYLIVRDGRIIPVEVKSASGGRLKSLRVYFEKYTESPYGICLQQRADVLWADKICYAPLYSVL